MLIKNEIELKGILGGVQQQISMGTMEPFIKQAELEYLEPVLGTDFLEEISSYDDEAVDKAKKLREYLQISVAHYALAHAAPQLVVAIGDVGMAMNVQGGMAAVPKWTYAELVKTGLNTGDSFLEKALIFLEKNEDLAIDDTKVFQTWLDSECFVALKEGFLQNATTMTRYFPALQGSRRMFIKLRGYLQEAESDWLPGQLGEDLVASLLTHRDSSELIEKKAVDYVRYVIVNKAFSKAIPYLNIGRDFRLTHDISGLPNEEALDRDRRDGLKVASDDSTAANLEKLLSYLDKYSSETVFPEYYGSDLRAERQKRKGNGRFINDPKKTYVVI